MCLEMFYRMFEIDLGGPQRRARSFDVAAVPRISMIRTCNAGFARKLRAFGVPELALMICLGVWRVSME